MVDYQSLYEKERLENDINRRQISRLETKQRVLECSFRNFRRLQDELSLVQTEAEERNGKIQSFLASFLPQFRSDSREARFEPTQPDPRKHVLSPKVVVIPPPASTNPPVVASASTQPQLSPAIPDLQYNWDEVRCPPGSSRYLTRPIQKLDELKLSMRFDVNSRELPTKIQLEIKDASDRVVFKKRQNIYYIKLQERIPTLDAEQDYRLEVTTITGPDESTKHVMIYNKHHEEEKATPVPAGENVVEAVISPHDLSFASAIQEFIEEVKFLEAKPIAGEDFVASVRPQHVDHPDTFAVKKVSCVVLKRRLMSPSSSAALVMQRKLAVPDIKYRWQRGFRKAPNGRYLKFPILRIVLRFHEQFELLPCFLRYSVSGGAFSETKAFRLSQNESVCEFQLTDDREFEVSVVPAEEGGEWLVPKFSMNVNKLTDDLLNEWQVATATVIT